MQLTERAVAIRWGQQVGILGEQIVQGEIKNSRVLGDSIEIQFAWMKELARDDWVTVIDPPNLMIVLAETTVEQGSTNDLSSNLVVSISSNDTVMTFWGDDSTFNIAKDQ